MKCVRTLFLSAQAFFFSTLMGLFFNDPLILPEFGSYNDWDKHNNGSNIIVLNDRGLNIKEPDAFIKNLPEIRAGKYLLYTSSKDNEYVASFITSKIGGIVSQSSEFEILRTGILKIAGEGSKYYCSNIEKILLKNDTASKLELWKGLSVREREILALVKAGLTNIEIAQRLYLSTKTVGRHKENIKSKLNLKHSNELYVI